MLYRIANLIQKEVLQISRDWLLIVILIAGPVLQLSLLAWSTSKGVANLSLAVLDMDSSADSRALIAYFDNTKELMLQHRPQSMRELQQLLDMGASAGGADIGVVIPANFSQELRSSVRAPARAPQVGLISGATNQLAASTGLAMAGRAISSFVADARAQGVTLPVELRTTVLFNPTFNTRYYTIPAMIGLIVFELSLILASLGLTREREIGTLEQLIIMPFRRIEIVVGKAVPPLLITLADFPLMLFIAVQVFGTPLRGSLALLVALTALFITAEVGWGLLLSTVARTQQQAVLFVFVQAIIDITFSGFLVPVENLPWLLNVVSNVVPLRHYLVIIRSLMLKGVGLEVLWPQVLALAILAVVIGTVAMRNLGRRLD